MKRFIWIAVLLACVLTAVPSQAARMYFATCLTGGGDCLDGIDAADTKGDSSMIALAAGDGALVILDSGSTTPVVYLYRVYASSASEVVPSVIIPNSNPGTLRWHLANIVAATYGATSPTGVQITGSNGTVTILGLGDGYDEDLKIDLNTTENVIGISSPSSGALKIDFGTLNMATSGYILGAIKVVAKTSDYTIGTDEAKEAYGGFFLNTAASTRTFTLPSAVGGMSVCVRNGQGVNQILRLTAGTGDYIVLDGARTSATGEYIGATASVTNQVCVVAADATDWYVTSKIGTWTEQ